MLYRGPCVEQLDRAAEELHAGDAQSARIALILIDNTVELVLHRRCEYLFDTNGGHFGAPDPAGPFTRARRHQVLGRFFDRKLNFLREHGDLAPVQAEFIRISHDMRSTAYHSGVALDDVVRPLATEYYALACDLFGRLSPRSVSCSIREVFTSHFARHVSPGAANRPFEGPPEPEELAASLRRACPPSEIALPAALSAHLVERVQRIGDLADYLATGNPQGNDLASVLKETQWWHDLFDNIPPHLEDRTPEYDAYIQARVRAMRSSWRPRHEKLPLERWKTRAEEVADADSHRALARFERLSGETEYILEALTQSAGALDQYVEEQIERARDRRAGL